MSPSPVRKSWLRVLMCTLISQRLREQHELCHSHAEKSSPASSRRNFWEHTIALRSMILSCWPGTCTVARARSGSAVLHRVASKTTWWVMMRDGWAIVRPCSQSGSFDCLTSVNSGLPESFLSNYCIPWMMQVHSIQGYLTQANASRRAADAGMG